MGVAMTTPSNLSEQILAVPDGAGSVASAGQTFQADPYSGTGRYAVPIELPAGHAGLTPSLQLTYSTHSGSGVAGMGWSLGLASVQRRTDKGLPTFMESEDLFALQGDELVPLGGGAYRHRIDQRFARIHHVTGSADEGGENYWVVRERDGTRVIYGRVADARLHDGGDRIATWYATKKQDAHGNEVVYTYARDAATREVVLTQIDWANGCYRVVLSYEERPDPTRSAREGFLHEQRKRLTAVEVQVRRTSTGAMYTWRRYSMSYVLSEQTGRSLLKSVQITGFRPSDGSFRALPALSFGYTTGAQTSATLPYAERAKWHELSSVPVGTSLASPELSLVRQSGSGLPDLLETTSSGQHRLYRNLGGGTFARAEPILAPVHARLGTQGTFISDMSGDGWGDLVLEGGRRIYRGVPGGGWGSSYARVQAPSVDLNAPDVRLTDLDGDGVADALQARHGGGFRWWRNLGEGLWEGPFLVMGGPDLSLADPRVHLVDLSGDGLDDLVYVSARTVKVWPGLGRGQFGAAYTMQPCPDLGENFAPDAIRFVDLTGSGQADLVFVQNGTVKVAANLGGVGFGTLQTLSGVTLSSRGHVEPVDLLGTGTQGLLFSDDGTARGSNWRFLELHPDGTPDLLTQIDNGMGATTTLTYGSSAAHWAQDRAEGRPWRTHLPSAQRVVDQIETTDSVTGITLGVSYRYHHGVYDGEEREFRGFAMVEQLDREADDDDPQPLAQVRTVRFFHTGFEVALRDVYAAHAMPLPRDEVPPAPWAHRALRGQLVREEIYALDGAVPAASASAARPYQIQHTTWQVFPIQRNPGTTRYAFAPLPINKRVIHTERTTDGRVVDTTTTYDLHAGTGAGYGLPVEVREKGYGRRGTFTTAHEVAQTEELERYTTTTYVHRDVRDTASIDDAYTPSYLAGFPSEITRYGVTGSGDVLLSRERFFYDDNGVADYQGLGYPGSSTTVGLTHGQLVCHLMQVIDDATITATYPGGSGASTALSARGDYLQESTTYSSHVQRMKYDSRGMVIGTKDPRGNEATFEYDATYSLFPIEHIDAAAHPTTLTRGELPFQVASVVDANGNTTSFTYEPTGLPETTAVQGKFVSSAWQGDPSTHPTEQYTYDFDSVPISITVETRQVRLGDTHTTVRYVDGMGRTVQERHEAEPDPASPSTPRWRVTGWQIFNHKGLVVQAYQPTFSGSSDYAEGSTSTASLVTTYDPLGRPTRVTYPDETYESTTYHPWVQQARDRNDNAGDITGSDPRYGAFLNRFEDHVDTPTTTWLDAFGRTVAVGEDNGVALGTSPEQAARVTTYQLVAGAFTGTSYTLTLNRDLAENYFVMVLGAVDSPNPALDNVAVRVSADPFGTGDLSATSNKNELTLTRGSAAEGDWEGTIVVWECEGDPDGAGFRLRDVREVTLSSTSNTGVEQTSAVTTNARWKDLDQIACYGGLRGGGVSTPSAGVSEAAAICVKCTPTGDDTLTVGRWVPTSLPEATVTVYVIEWGSEHSIQRVTVTGTAGGDGINATSEYNTASLSSSVARDESWCWMSGWAKTNELGSGFPGLALALGDGVATNSTESSVAVGSEHTIERSVLVTVHSHPGLAVDWRKVADGNVSNTTVSVTVDVTAQAENYNESSNPRQTTGQRVALPTNTADSAVSDAADVLVSGRHTGQTTLVMTRQDTGQAFAAWVQSIDAAGITYTPHDVHITRSVYDLKDQVLEVFDARALGFATWSFSYDLAGNRLVTAHATAMGTRYALADAAGNPIWARDAKGVEVNRTFDTLNRPLAETSDDGSGDTLRRQWTYIAYNESDPDFSTYQAKNLFGPAEEVRDADGLRFFEYDWRGLVTKTSYRFWSQKDGSNRAWDNGASDLWSTGSGWDPAIPSAARSALSDWLTLDDLTDTTTVEIEMTYDAAARPTQVDYPEGMSTRMSYNAAGTLDTVEMDRGTGAGFFNVVVDLRYDARGKLTELTHGNGVVTQRTYDTDLERLTRIFTELPGSPDVEFQDLNYDYDPAGNPVQIEDALTTSSFKANQIIPNTRTFYYDPRNRLVRATGKKHATVSDRTTNVLVTSPDPNDYDAYDYIYAYDEVGNFRINQEYNSSRRANLNYKEGRIDLFNGTNAEAIDERADQGNYRYDANGNTTHTPRQEELGYTFDNQPNYVDLGGGGEVRYFRHADQRVVRMVNKGSTKALGIYLGPWEYHQRQGTTAYTKVVVHVETTSRHAQVERVLSGSDPDSVDIYYIHTDHLGSGHVLTSSAGALLSQEEYLPYGRASDRRDARNRYRYIGVERDEDTGLCMTGPRTYDPVMGRFGQGDPITSSNLSPYGYSAGQPVRRTDPNGYSSDEPKITDGDNAESTGDPAPKAADLERPGPLDEPGVRDSLVFFGGGVAGALHGANSEVRGKNWDLAAGAAASTVTPATYRSYEGSEILKAGEIGALANEMRMEILDRTGRNPRVLILYTGVYQTDAIDHAERFIWHNGGRASTIGYSAGGRATLQLSRSSDVGVLDFVGAVDPAFGTQSDTMNREVGAASDFAMVVFQSRPDSIGSHGAASTAESRTTTLINLELPQYDHGSIFGPGMKIVVAHAIEVMAAGRE